MPQPDEITELTALRRALHQRPELSGAEAETAARIAALMTAAGADRVLTGIGGTGVVAAFDGPAPGPSVMFRAELDALPITEAEGRAHRSLYDGVGHLCGHDGHMAALIGLARRLAAQRPARGTVWLLFQPAEETGAGAALMLADPALPRFDYGFAVHNYPGLAQGRARLWPGVMSCASVGLQARLTGATAHASEPEKARTPTLALAEALPRLVALSRGAVSDPDFRLVTVTHMSMGRPAFGITPGEAEIWATLRTANDATMAALREGACAILRQAAQAHGLDCAFDWHDDFAASVNHPEATRIATEAARATGLEVCTNDLPMRPSEDFGRFGQQAATAMIFLGAGKDHPPLHAADYDYPDALLAPTIALFSEITRRLTDQPSRIDPPSHPR